ncbi:MAG: PRC-barrel domain-containing protein [Chloroflexi bacterium]|nr:PRC-barrel domain-containing protein [Chloroflexota bacterium]
MKLNELKGRPVVATDRAQKIGSVQDVILGSTYQNIEALLVKVDHNVPELVIPTNRIHAIGPDAVTVETAESLRTLDQERDYFGLPRGTAVQKSRVMSETGKIIGTISDIEIDPLSGQVLSFIYDGSVLAEVLGQHHRLDPKTVIGFRPGIVTVREVPPPSRPS